MIFSFNPIIKQTIKITKTDKKTGAQDTHFIMTKASLFSDKQVEQMSSEFKEFLNNKFHKNIAIA